jgi:hypothetical protein
MALILACFAGTASAQVPVADFFSTTSKLNGTSLPAGTRIEAFDSDGIRCGLAEANADGSFLIHVYGNDPMTPNVDEGAREGEALAWRVNGEVPQNVEWVRNIIGAFSDLRFENNGAKEMRLDGPTATEAKTWTAVKNSYRR